MAVAKEKQKMKVAILVYLNFVDYEPCLSYATKTKLSSAISQVSMTFELCQFKKGLKQKRFKQILTNVHFRMSDMALKKRKLVIIKAFFQIF